MLAAALPTHTNSTQSTLEEAATTALCGRRSPVAGPRVGKVAAAHRPGGQVVLQAMVARWRVVLAAVAAAVAVAVAVGARGRRVLLDGEGTVETGCRAVAPAAGTVLVLQQVPAMEKMHTHHDQLENEGKLFAFKIVTNPKQCDLNIVLPSC